MMTKDTPDSKEPPFLTKADKWIIATFAMTAVAAIILFITTLALLFQFGGKLSEQKKQYDEIIQAMKEDFNVNVTNLLRQISTIKGEQIEAVKNTSISLETQKQAVEVKLKAISKKNSESIAQISNVVDWSVLGNSTLLKVFSTRKNFSNAQENCVSYGGRLASSSSSTMRSVIAAKIPSMSWIGLYQPFQNESWVWTDGLPHNQPSTVWMPQPTGTGKCAALIKTSEKLQSQACTNQLPYVCEVLFHAL